MTRRHINFHQSIIGEKRITIFTPPEAFEPDRVGETYEASLIETDHAVIVEVRMAEKVYFATNLEIRDIIASGGREIWVSHLNLDPTYVLDQCKLTFPQISEMMSDPRGVKPEGRHQEVLS